MADFPIILINLDESTDRLKRITRALEAQDARFGRLSAFDGRGVPPETISEYDDADARRYMGRSLTGGEIGCFLSHLRAAKAVVESGSAYGLVLEDDALPLPEAIAQVRAFIAWQTARGAPDWYVANLGALKTKIASTAGVLHIGENTTQIQRAHYFPMRTTALLWTAPGARAFIETCLPISAPVDNHLRHWLAPLDMGLSVVPPLVSTTGAQSEIDTAGKGVCRAKINRGALYQLRRVRRLYGDKIIALLHKARFSART